MFGELGELSYYRLCTVTFTFKVHHLFQLFAFVSLALTIRHLHFLNNVAPRGTESFDFRHDEEPEEEGNNQAVAMDHFPPSRQSDTEDAPSVFHACSTSCSGEGTSLL
jgi:hypothetical protein